MNYRIVVLSNDVYKKTLDWGYVFREVDKSYNSLRRVNRDNIIFPKRFLNMNGIFPLNHKIALIREVRFGEYFEPDKLVTDNKKRTLYNNSGVYDWVIERIDNYYIEETFWLCGNDPKRHDGRVRFKDIVGLLFKGTENFGDIKQVVVVFNKLLMFNDTEFDMVVCKCTKDAQRLHRMLFNAMPNTLTKNFMFLGTAKYRELYDYYNFIEEKTGWDRDKIKRTTTRP